jgi:hypothetical protein
VSNSKSSVRKIVTAVVQNVEFSKYNTDKNLYLSTETSSFQEEETVITAAPLPPLLPTVTTTTTTDNDDNNKFNILAVTKNKKLELK